MPRRYSLLGAILIALSASPALSKDLGIGDPAPKITVAEFVKGEPIKEFEKGKVYVVEFWATWCGPCKTSIPHLTAMQKAHKDARFLGVSVFEQDFSGVKPFVKEMGDKMDYTVATDSVPEGKTGQEGAMGKDWMLASGEGGIPTAFLVNGDGRIAWIGHPMELEKPLEKVLEGAWDLSAARDKREQAKAEELKITEIERSLLKAQGEGTEALLKALDAAIADVPKLESSLALQKFLVLNKAKSTRARALAYGSKLVDGLYKDEAQALATIAWSLVAPDEGKPEPDAAKLGLRAALRADEVVEKKDFSIADTLAKAYFVTGDTAKALSTQERALKLAAAVPGVETVELKDRLEEYRKAADKPK